MYLNFIQRWEFIKENKKTWTRSRKWSRKKESFFFFSWSTSCFLSCFLGRFLGQVLVFLFSCFLVFLYEFPPLSHLSVFFYLFSLILSLPVYPSSFCSVHISVSFSPNNLDFLCLPLPYELPRGESLNARSHIFCLFKYISLSLSIFLSLFLSLSLFIPFFLLLYLPMFKSIYLIFKNMRFS